jgi:hypothetical protein
MSELLQSGHHPDADQLNAFVEHALPPHEQQQTLAHLAICADCRAIVSLSLPVDESPAVQAEPVRKRWFSGWNLAWPAAAALAGLVVIIYVRNAATTRSSTAGTQVAISQSQASLAVPEASTIPAPTSPPPSSEQRQSSPRPRAAIGAAKVPNSQKTDTVTDAQSIATLPIHGRNFVGLQKGQPASPTGGIQGSLGTSINGSAAGLSAGAGAILPQAPVGNTLDQLQQNAFRAANKPSGQSATPAQTAPTAAPTMILKQSDVVPPPPPAPPPPAAAATTVNVNQGNQTIEVTDAAAPGAIVSAMNNGLVFDQSMSIVAQHPLPSRLPALSVASTNHHTLAIDTQNTLFFSDDDGKHWKTIPSQWRGRAVKVDVASSTASSERNSAIATSKAQPASGSAAIGGPVLSSTRQRNSTLAGTVVDASGAVIPGASVVVSDATAPVVRSVTADGAGRYRVNDLVPGSYQVAAEAPGFNKQQLAVTLTASQQGLTNITLSVGQSAQNVAVDASAMALENRSLDKKKISELQSAASQSPRFEITTDTGEYWTSTDGQNWKRK